LTGAVDALAVGTVEDGTRAVKVSGFEGTTTLDSWTSLRLVLDDVAWGGSSLLGARLGVVAASCLPVGAAGLTRAVDALAVGTVEDGTRAVKVWWVEGTTATNSSVVSLERNVDEVARVASSFLGARLGVVAASCLPVRAADLTGAVDALALGTVKDGIRPVKVSGVKGTTTSDSWMSLGRGLDLHLSLFA
jgi:hypothetical protein